MKTSVLIEMLGKPFSSLVKENHFPKLQPVMLQDKSCQAFANQLLGLPSKRESLKRKILLLIMSGIVTEIEQKESALHIMLSFEYRAERWLIEMSLTGQAWIIGDLYYGGELSQTKTSKWLITSACVTLSLIILFAGVYFFMKNPAQSVKLTTVDQFKINGKTPIAKHNMIHNRQTKLASSQPQETSHAESMSDTPSESLETAEESSPLEEDTAINDSEGNITLQIKPGMSGHDVAGLLEEYGLVRSKKEMIEIFSLLGIQGKIQTGVFYIPQEATYADVIKIITEK